MKNDSEKKHTNRKHVLTLIIFLLPLLACALFADGWIKAQRFKAKGENLLAEKKYDSAIKEFSKALAIIENIDDRGNNISSDISDLYRLRGIAYFKLKDYDKSLADFNKSIEANPNAREAAYPERGNLFLVKKDYEKALADFEKARPNYSSDYRPALGMAIAYYETQKYEKANKFTSLALRDLNDLENSEKQFNYDPDDHIKAFEYAIKLSEQKGDTKNAESEKQALEQLKKKHNKN